MPNLTPLEIYNVALHAGFSQDEAVTWTAIALAESNGNPRAHNPSGEDSRGLWQINVAVHSDLSGDMYDPLTNAKAAFEISGGGENMSPWTVTHQHNAGTNKDYRQYMDEAQAAANDPDAGNFAGVAGYGDPSAGGGLQLDPDGHYQPVSDADLIDSWHAPRSGGRLHEGIDIFADKGTAVHSVTSGTIVGDFESSLGGVVVNIRGDDGRDYYYAHMNEGSVSHLTVGQHVDAGDQIGEVGNTGNAASTPPHLHFGVKENDVPINPFDFLQGLSDVEDAGWVDGGGPDADSDGLSDTDEEQRGLDPNDPDSDDDGLSDGDEIKLGTDPLNADTDGDSLADAEELLRYHSDPTKADSDADGMSDDLEVFEGRDPARGIPLDLRRAAEANGTIDIDTDGDGLSDIYEFVNGLDPAQADSDRDGLDDSLELMEGTDPVLWDTDGDRLSDGYEIGAGQDPLAADDVLVKILAPDVSPTGASDDDDFSSGDGHDDVAP